MLSDMQRELVTLAKASYKSLGLATSLHQVSKRLKLSEGPVICFKRLDKQCGCTSFDY